MSTSNELHTLLGYLHIFQPCKGVLVVGAGSGNIVPLLSQMNPSEVVLAEADEKLIERMKSTQLLAPSWHVRESVVFKDTQECEYYHTNQSATNGIAHPENLHSAWPNLRELGAEVCESVSFATLEKECGASQINWLILECYGAEQIIQANAERLEHYEVVVTKSLKTEQESLDAFMQGMNYRSMYTAAEKNPQVVLVVYVKEYAQLLEQTTEELQAFRAKLSETEVKNKETLEAKESLAQQLQTLQTQNEESKKALETKVEEHITKINALIKRRDSLVRENSVLAEKQKVLEEKVNILSDAKIEQLVDECLKAEDIFEVLNKYLLEDLLPDNKKFELACSIAEKVGTTTDRMQGVGLLNQSRLFMSKETHIASKQYERLSHLATMLNQLDLSVDMLIESMALTDTNYTKKVASGYSKIRSASQKAQQHGHDLLIDYIVKNIPKDEIGDKLLIEIGTTRENVPGQGSTEQLAKLCKEKNIKFVTVDMDPHNTRWANFVSQKKELGFQAVTAKGEDYLKDDADGFDFVFLDAYDFDHGKHSELRQTRYEKNLGSKIDETECHIMHLKCAYSVEAKLKDGGVVCIDDTWQDDNGIWMAKGTLAVSYLLNHGFKLLEYRNNAVLLSRDKEL